MRISDWSSDVCSSDLGTVGCAASTPEYRYTFDWLYLFGGIPLPVAVAAFFAIPELITFLTSGGKIARTGKLTGGALQGVRDVLKHWFLIVRSSALGAFMGIIPGLGGSTVEWLTYFLVKAQARDQNGKASCRERGSE